MDVKELVIVGEAEIGKTTLANALLGWDIFPHLRGLGQWLREITQAALELSETDPMKVFGWPDNMKFRSCMTLFAQISEDDLFARTLDKFFGGQEDSMTLELLKQKGYSL